MKARSMNLDMGLRGEILELRLFIPGRPPSPNRDRRRHWTADARAVAERRRTAHLSAIDARNRSGRADDFPIPRAELEIVFHLARAAGDLYNLLAGSKAFIDGLVDGGVLAGDGVGKLDRITLGWTKAVGIEGVEITLRERR